MIKLNLTDLSKSEIKYKVSKFPDGQQQVTIIEESFYLSDNEVVEVISRMNSFLDLELIICTVMSLREIVGVTKIELYCPLILGSRSDRKFEQGSNNYLKTVICPIINSLGFSKVRVLHPHSDVLEACINNFEKVPNSLFSFATHDLFYHEDGYYEGLKKATIVSPDAGALKGIYKLLDGLNLKNYPDILVCNKSRDNDGKLTRTEVPMKLKDHTNDLVIIDDLCDGGYTFIVLAKKLKEQGAKKVYLYISHAYFSKGLDVLKENIDHVYCTNSVKDIEDDFVTQFKLIWAKVKLTNTW